MEELHELGSIAGNSLAWPGGELPAVAARMGQQDSRRHPKSKYVARIQSSFALPDVVDRPPPAFATAAR